MAWMSWSSSWIVRNSCLGITDDCIQSTSSQEDWDILVQDFFLRKYFLAAKAKTFLERTWTKFLLWVKKEAAVSKSFSEMVFFSHLLTQKKFFKFFWCKRKKPLFGHFCFFGRKCSLRPKIEEFFASLLFSLPGIKSLLAFICNYFTCIHKFLECPNLRNCITSI